MNFANRVNFGVTSLLGGFILLLLVGSATILSQTFKASNENPAQNLKSD
jgi:hypothetical protein